MLPRNKMTLLALSILALSAQAAPVTKQMIIAPHCLVKKLVSQDQMQIRSSSASLALIETTAAGLEQFIEAKHQPSATACGGFINVTDDWQQAGKKQISFKAFLQQHEMETRSAPHQYNIRFEGPVNALLQKFNPQLMWQDLTALSNTATDQFPDRHPNSKTGIKAAQWLKAKVEALAKDNHRSDFTTWEVQTGSNYKQPSIVFKLGDSNEPGIVIGGHMDTLSASQWSGTKPGADDDGTGTVTVMGVARTVLESGIHFKKPIYFIWYAAEEEGLIGSGYVVKDFVKKKIPVDAVVQFDMTGYANKNDRTIWLVTDHVDSNLTSYLETLVKTYVKQPVGLTRCGYGCSDHASWNKGGFKSSFPFEAAFNKDNPDIHTAQDTMDHLSLDHMTDYAKLGIAFVTELAEPVSKNT